MFSPFCRLFKCMFINNVHKEKLRTNLCFCNHSRIWCGFGSFIVRDIRGAIVHSHEEQLITHGDLILLCHREKRKTTMSIL